MTERIALFLPSLHGGGAERVMVTLANSLVTRGFKVDLILTTAEGPYLAEVDGNVRLIDLGAARVLTSLPPLIRYLRRERPTTMLSALSHANVIAAVARRLSKVPFRLILAEHTTRNAPGMPTKKNVWTQLLLLMMRITYPRVDAIVSVSAGSADALASTLCLPRSAVTVIYNPIDCDQIYERSLESVEQHPWFERGMPPVVLAVGRLCSAKDYKTLIHAVASLRKRRPLKLIILGEGELKSELQSQIDRAGLREDVELMGFVVNPYVWMRKASVFVLSSAWEGLPTVLIEAMACGTPVVSTNCPSGPAEILQDGKWGRLVPVGDAVALANAIDTVLSDESPIVGVSRARTFGVERAVDAYLDLFQMSRY